MTDDIYGPEGTFVPFTYLIGWTKLNKWYYGARWCKKAHPSQLWSSYFTTSKYVKKFREENGEPDFIQVTQTFKTAVQAQKFECYTLQFIDAKCHSNFLNRSNGAKDFGCTAGTFSEDHKRKISDANKRRFKSEDARQVISDANRGRPKSEGTREKLRKANQGKKQSQDTINKRVLSNTGKKRLESTKQKIRDSKKGKKRKPFTQEHKQKISEALKTYHAGVYNQKREEFEDFTALYESVVKTE